MIQPFGDSKYPAGGANFAEMPLVTVFTDVDGLVAKKQEVTGRDGL